MSALPPDNAAMANDAPAAPQQNRLRRVRASSTFQFFAALLAIPVFWSSVDAAMHAVHSGHSGQALAFTLLSGVSGYVLGSNGHRLYRKAQQRSVA